jgi:hypothetical protein
MNLTPMSSSWMYQTASPLLIASGLDYPLALDLLHGRFVDHLDLHPDLHHELVLDPFHEFSSFSLSVWQLPTTPVAQEAAPELVGDRVVEGCDAGGSLSRARTKRWTSPSP